MTATEPVSEPRGALRQARLVVGAAAAFVLGGIFMKASAGLTDAAATSGFLLCFLAGAWMQAVAMKDSEMGVTYLVIIGLECVLAFACGTLLFAEAASLLKILAVALIIAGISMLNGALETVVSTRGAFTARLAIVVLGSLAMFALVAPSASIEAARLGAADATRLSQMLTPGHVLTEFAQALSALGTAPSYAALVLAAALAFVVGGICMKLSHGATIALPTAAFLACFVAGASLQGMAMTDAEMGVTYLIIVGLECVLAFAAGTLLFRERLAIDKLMGVALIVTGIIALRA